MISTAHRFIYLHAPKTGGNSIQSLLLPFSDDRIVLRRHQDGYDRFEVKGAITPYKHATLADYAFVLRSELERYRCVMSIRHPLDRAVSFYFSPHRWMVKDTETGAWTPQPAHWSITDFEEILRKIQPMSEFIRIGGQTRRPDFLIRFERISVDFRRCVEMLGLATAVSPLPHRNRSSAPTLANEALKNPTVRRLVQQHFEGDYEIFGYSTD